MLAEALICIVVAINYADLTPKGKYFLIETKVNGENEDIGKHDRGRHDYINPEENPLKPMMTKEGKIYKISRR